MANVSAKQSVVWTRLICKANERAGRPGFCLACATTTLMFRAEAPHDVIRVLFALDKLGENLPAEQNLVKWILTYHFELIEPGAINDVRGRLVFVPEFRWSQQMQDQLKRAFDAVEDSHVMSQSIDYAWRYDGEREDRFWTHSLFL